MGKIKRELVDRLERERLRNRRVVAVARREQKIREHRRAIAGAEAGREWGGDKWADRVIAYHRAELVKLGVDS